ncbi:MAG TPA: hypothetical protein VLC53_15425 [Myxococcota bacterium]|nr:hypothetical protein [Myxococcota bacterium]
MFSPRKRPLLLVADRLLALRMSLNTPVVATPDLPAGPARAAIAVHSEAGRTCFTVAVRSLRNGVSVLYELEGEDTNDASGIAVALDAALSFGESMGFLFDDELVTARSEAVLRAALARLREIVAPPAPDVGETVPSLDLEPPPEEILLDDELELEPALEPSPRRQPPARRARAQAQPRREPPKPPRDAPSEPAVATPAVAPPAPPPAAAAASLTKFRHVAASGDAPEKTAPPARTQPPAEPGRPAETNPGSRTGKGGAALLGRVKPVRLRSPDAPAPIPALLRLLSSF